MARIPEVGEPPSHRPSWLKSNYPNQPSELNGIVKELLYRVILPSRLLNKWPYANHYQKATLKAKWFVTDPAEGSHVYLVEPHLDGKVNIMSDGTECEYIWIGFPSGWLVSLQHRCHCKIELLLCRGCQCGGI